MGDILGTILGGQTTPQDLQEKRLSDQIAEALQQPQQVAEPQRIHPAQAIMLALADAIGAYGATLSSRPLPSSALGGLRERRQARADRETQAMREKGQRELAGLDIKARQAGREADIAASRQQQNRAALEEGRREEAAAKRETAAEERAAALEEKLLNSRLDNDREIAELRSSTDMAIANLRNEGKGDRLREDMFRQNSTVLPDLLGAAQDQAALVREGKETRSAEELKEEYLLAVEGQLVGIDEDVKPFLKRAALHWERTVGKAIRAAEEERAKQEAERKRTSIPLTEREQARGGADPLLGVLRSVLETQGQSALNVPQRPPFIGKQ